MLYPPSTQNLPGNPLSSTKALSTAEENTTITTGDTTIHLQPVGPHVIGDGFIYFWVGLCSLFLTLGIANLCPLLSLPARTLPPVAQEIKAGRVSSLKLPTLYPPSA